MALLCVPFGLSSLTLLVASYAGYLLVRRYFLSPIASIPGPLLAGLSSWYECYYDVFQPAQYVFKIKDLHENYGPIVRVGPNDISISDPDFIDAIYAPGSGHKRDKDNIKNKALGVDSSVGGSIAHDLHKNRREALNPFFSRQSINRLDPQLENNLTQLQNILAKACETGEVINLSDVYFGFANDIVQEFCFGNSPGLLHDLPLASMRRENVSAVLGSVKIMLHFGWIRDAMQMLPLSIGIHIMPPGVRDMLTFREGIRSQIDGILAAKPSPDETPSVFTHLRDNPSLPGSEKSPKRLEDEASLVVMAGTYSPMLSLVIAQYHLLAEPQIMDKLRTELATNPSAVRPTQLEQLPYLSSIIQEAHRLSFGLTGRNPRVSPDETITYTHTTKANKTHTYALPPGTSISISTLLIHTNESIFPEPWKFEPERWMAGDPATLAMRRRCMLSFMRGPRACVGMHLANTEMAVAVAAMARWNMRLFETTEEDVAFLHDYHVLCPKLGSKGLRVQVLGPHV